MAYRKEIIIQKLDDGRAGYIIFENFAYTYFHLADTKAEAHKVATQMSHKFAYEDGGRPLKIRVKR